MLTFRLRAFLALLAFSAFTLVFVSVGIRWHVYRARASLHARQEMEHTFEAADCARSASMAGDSAEDRVRASWYRKLADMHEKAARENTRLRQFYESCW